MTTFETPRSSAGPCKSPVGIADPNATAKHREEVPKVTNLCDQSEEMCMKWLTDAHHFLPEAHSFGSSPFPDSKPTMVIFSSPTCSTSPFPWRV